MTNKPQAPSYVHRAPGRGASVVFFFLSACLTLAWAKVIVFFVLGDGRAYVFGSDSEMVFTSMFLSMFSIFCFFFIVLLLIEGRHDINRILSWPDALLSEDDLAKWLGLIQQARKEGFRLPALPRDDLENATNRNFADWCSRLNGLRDDNRQIARRKLSDKIHSALSDVPRS